MNKIDSNKTNTVSARQAHAEQILNAAAELFRRFGYKRVTVDDIATQANIGRGTIYQFWKTREALYTTVIQREFLEIIDEILLAIRHDPNNALPHRIVRTEFLAVMHRPILHAIFTADIIMMGKLGIGKGGIDKALEAHQNMIFDEYQQLLVEHGLLRDDISYAELDHALAATVIGFFMVEPISGHQKHLDQERQADLLATTVQRAFEIEAGTDAIQAVAPRVIEFFTEIYDAIQAHIRQVYE
jgi:AcrR family transcriptional regulator